MKAPSPNAATEMAEKTPPATALEEVIGYRFTNITLLSQALTHPSICQSVSEVPLSNQRLEFLGDAALQISLSTLLYHRLPQAKEGQLTKLRASLVSTKALAQVASAASLGSYLQLSRSEIINSGRHRGSTLADTLEAVIGAVFLDAGIAAVNEVVTRLFSSLLKDVATAYTEESSNPKGTLQEIIQSMDSALPIYHIVEESGPPHDRTFIAEVHWQGDLLGSAAGPTKKTAETEAARAALRHPKVIKCQK